jgi:hypothetical protein
MLLRPARRVVDKLTEDCTGRIVTGETGLAHTRTSNRQLMARKSSFPSRCCGGSGTALGGRRRDRCGPPLHSRDG